MISETQNLWEILVPTIRRGTGKPYRTRFHRVWDSKVREISGGLTVMPPTTNGQWVNSTDEIFEERMIPVRILATDEQMSDIIDMSLEYYDQLAVLAYKVSDTVILRHR